MTPLFLAASIALAQGTGATPAQDSLGTVAIGTRQVPIVIPAVSAPVGPTVDLPGGRWLVGPAGNLLRPVEADLRARYLEAQKRIAAGTPAVWRTHVFVFTRGEILERRADGVWRMRRASLEPSQVDEVYRGIALFKAAVEALTDGEVSVKLDATVDDDPERVVIEGGARPDLAAELTDRLLAPRYNDDAFDADDQVYRGPYQSVLGIHSLLTPFPDSPVGRRRTPVSWVGFYTDSEAPTAAGIAHAMVRKWLAQVEWRAAQQGFVAAETGDAKLWSGAWSSLASISEPTREQFVSRRYPAPLAAGTRWESVSGEPWSKLPYLGPQQVAALAGIQPNGALPNAAPGTPVLDERFEPSVEACALMGPASNQVLLVRDDAAGALSDAVEARPATELLGYTVSHGRRALVYRTSGLQAGVGEAVSLGILRAAPVAPASGEPQLAESLVAEGHFAVARQSDPERGTVIAITERGAFRWGSATLFARPDGLPLFDLAKTPTLGFAVKLDSRDSYRMELLGPDGSVVAAAALGAQPAAPADAPTVPDVDGTVNLPAGAWVSVKARFAPEGPGAKPVHAVRVVPSAYWRYLERRQIEPGRISFADFMLSDAPADWGTAEPAQSEDPALAKAAGFGTELTADQQTALLEMLRSRNESVRLNAAAALTRAKCAPCVPALIEQSKSATPAIAEMALRALRFQGGDEAWAAVRWCVDTGPFDHNRTSAARQLGERHDATDAATVSVLLAARSWHARLAAAQALGGMASREASIILMAFLQEMEPAVRLSVVEGADLSHELVNRRLLYLAVNDPSQAVRTRSYVRLLDTSVAEFRNEALKGVRDDSLGVRLALLDAMAAKPNEAYRGALRLAVTDASPTVRARALVGMAALPEPVKIEEFENVLTDGHPSVQRALLDLAKAKGIALPEPAIQSLLKSADPAVVEGAKGLPQ